MKKIMITAAVMTMVSTSSFAASSVSATLMAPAGICTTDIIQAEDVLDAREYSTNYWGWDGHSTGYLPINVKVNHNGFKKVRFSSTVSKTYNVISPAAALFTDVNEASAHYEALLDAHVYSMNGNVVTQIPSSPATIITVPTTDVSATDSIMKQQLRLDSEGYDVTNTVTDFVLTVRGIAINTPGTYKAKDIAKGTDGILMRATYIAECS